jgi:AGZA family xanthine/uracil permease-like MFS transporter
MHSYVWTPGDTVLALEPAVDWTFGYALMSGTFLMARWITRPQER